MHVTQVLNDIAKQSEVVTDDVKEGRDVTQDENNVTKQIEFVKDDVRLVEM